MNEALVRPKQKVEKKLITDLKLEDVTNDIETKLEDLGVDKNKFSVPFKEIIQKLFRFLKEYEIKYEDFASPDRLLRGLCLVDMWISTASCQPPVSCNNKFSSVLSVFNTLTFV